MSAPWRRPGVYIYRRLGGVLVCIYISAPWRRPGVYIYVGALAASWCVYILSILYYLLSYCVSSYCLLSYCVLSYCLLSYCVLLSCVLITGARRLLWRPGSALSCGEWSVACSHRVLVLPPNQFCFQAIDPKLLQFLRVESPFQSWQHVEARELLADYLLKFGSASVPQSWRCHIG